MSNSTKHGGSRSRLYRIWQNMRGRCQCPTDTTFKHYGARGISVCSAWQDFPTFRDWALSHGYSDALTIERVDNDGNYTPTNCEWITQAAQACNRRSSLGGVPSRLPLARANGISDDAFYYRVKAGWPPEIAATKPMHRNKRSTAHLVAHAS